MSLLLNGGRLAKFWTATNNTTTAALGSSAVFTMSEQISTDVSNDDNGLPTITIENVDASSAFQTFLDTYADYAASADTETFKYEDGTASSASSSAPVLLCAIAGAIISDGADVDKRRSWVGFVNVSKTSGSWSQQADNYAKPTLVLNGVAAKGSVSVASTFLTSFMVTPAALTWNSTTKKYGKVVFG